MLKKLLLLLLIGFAFTEINAQESIVSEDTSCGGNTYEFVSVTSPNAWDAYDVLATPTPAPSFGNDEGATATAAVLTIRYSTINSRWEYLLNATDVLFIHTASTIDAPALGWVDGPSFHCGASATLELRSENTGVLPVDREEFSDIKIYPNPSTGFINISNLKENSRVVISNITGQVVKDVVVGMNDNRIDIQDLSQGFYFVELEGKKTIKLLKR